jgi:hypothetical protein
MVHQGSNIKLYSVVIIISVVLNIIALFHPIFITEKGFDANYLHRGNIVYALPFIMTGIVTWPIDIISVVMGVGYINYLWISYVIYFYVLYLVKRKIYPIRQIIMMFLSIVIIIKFFFCHAIISDSENPMLEVIGGKMAGYYLILLSNILLFVTIIYIFLKEINSKRNTKE